MERVCVFVWGLYTVRQPRQVKSSRLLQVGENRKRDGSHSPSRFRQLTGYFPQIAQQQRVLFCNELQRNTNVYCPDSHTHTISVLSRCVFFFLFLLVSCSTPAIWGRSEEACCDTGHCRGKITAWQASNSIALGYRASLSLILFSTWEKNYS